MTRRFYLLGLVVVLLVVTAIALAMRANPPAPSSATATPTTAVPIEVEIETATLGSIQEGGGSGIATRQFIDNLFVHGLTADLPDLPAGQTYAGWLVKNGDIQTAVSTGQLTKQGDSYSLDYSSPVDYSAYDEVQITVQVGNSPAYGTLVLTGGFQTE